MNDLYLTLQGWIPHRLRIDGDEGLFLYNPHFRVIVNRKEILLDEIMYPEAYKFADLKIVSFSEIPQDIIEKTINLGLG